MFISTLVNTISFVFTPHTLTESKIRYFTHIMQILVVWFVYLGYFSWWEAGGRIVGALCGVAARTCSILLATFFSSPLVSVQVVHPYSSIDTTAAWKKLRFISSVRSDFHTCRSLLNKQGRAMKWCTPMDPHIWPGKSKTTSSNIHSAAMWGYRMWPWRPTRGGERSGEVAREGQGYPCQRHDMMMMMMMQILTWI